MVEEVVVVVMAAVVVMATIAMVFPPINLRTEVLPKAVAVLVLVTLLAWVFGTLVDLVMKLRIVLHHRLVGVECWMIVMSILTLWGNMEIR